MGLQLCSVASTNMATRTLKRWYINARKRRLGIQVTQETHVTLLAFLAQSSTNPMFQERGLDYCPVGLVIGGSYLESDTP